MSGAEPRRRYRPSLRTLLLVVNLVAVLLPLGGLFLLRLYENELVRQTQAELLAQAALVAAMYCDELVALPAGAAGEPLAAALGQYGRAVYAPDTFEETLRPLRPRLDLARDEVRGRAPEAVRPAHPPDRFAARAGAELTPTLQRAQWRTLAGLRVVDFEGRVVASTRGELGLSLAHREEVARALRGETVSLMRERISDEPPPPPWSISRGSSVRVFVAVPVVEQGRLLGAVVASRTPLSLVQALYVNRFQLVLLAVAVLALVLGVSLLTSRLLERPVRALMHQVRRAGEGDRDAMVPLRRPGTREVGELSEAFARMARALEGRADYIRSFARGVSHEFKTPLAALRGAIELLRDHWEGMTAAERERFLAMLEADTARLDRLVGRLHELARADVAQPGAESAAVAPILARIADRWREAGRTVALSPAAAALDGTRVAAPPEVLETVVGSLVENAFQHGGELAQVRLEARLQETPPRVALEISDDGAGISEANRARIFDAFFTTAREQGGSGLGLTIASALVRAHGGAIELLESARGAAFRVTLPRTRA